MMNIAVAKISVAFLIERLSGPTRWRRWLLRGISVSIMCSAIITFLLFYLPCDPVSANWDKTLIKEGKGKCWNLKAVNTWDVIVGSMYQFQDPALTRRRKDAHCICKGYWAFLDFALAAIPVDMVWRLQMSRQKKFALSCLLGMGVL